VTATLTMGCDLTCVAPGPNDGSRRIPAQDFPDEVTLREQRILNLSFILRVSGQAEYDGRHNGL